MEKSSQCDFQGQIWGILVSERCGATDGRRTEAVGATADCITSDEFCFWKWWIFVLLIALLRGTMGSGCAWECSRNSFKDDAFLPKIHDFLLKFDWKILIYQYSRTLKCVLTRDSLTLALHCFYIINSTFFNRKSGFLIRKSGFFHWKLTAVCKTGRTGPGIVRIALLRLQHSHCLEWRRCSLQ